MQLEERWVYRVAKEESQKKAISKKNAVEAITQPMEIAIFAAR